MHNAKDDDPRNDADADHDEDGLSNAEECMWGTNPWITDTDGDGATDGQETGAVPRSDGGWTGTGGGTPGFSDPADPTDGGMPGSRVRTTLYFGDDSGSHSEKYLLELACVDGDGMSCSRGNQAYGRGEPMPVALKPGCAYEVRLFHQSCKFGRKEEWYPNYDYTLELRDASGRVFLDDPQGLFQTDYYGTEYYGQFSFPALDKVATLTVPKHEIRHREIFLSHPENAANLTGVDGDIVVNFDDENPNDEDWDGVWNVDEISGRWGIVSNEQSADTYMIHRILMVDSYASYGDNEIRARLAEKENLESDCHANLDWCNPGCQSRIRRGPVSDESNGGTP